MKIKNKLDFKKNGKLTKKKLKTSEIKIKMMITLKNKCKNIYIKDKK